MVRVNAEARIVSDPEVEMLLFSNKQPDISILTTLAPALIVTIVGGAGDGSVLVKVN